MRGGGEGHFAAVLFDDLVSGGALQGSSTLDSFRVYGGARAARVFLVTSRGTWMLDVDEQGHFSLP